MCHFLSFVLTDDERILVGSLDSHSGVEQGWGLKPGKYRECEWTEDDDGDSLTIRVADGDESENHHRAIVLAKHKTRQSLLKSIKEGRTHKGDRFHYQNGKLHRDDGPAIERANGDKAWHLNGKYHRLDGPAVEYTNGYKAWYQNGKLHRLDGPAIEWVDGSTEWHLNGKCHRLDGPAVEYASGTKQWYQNGEFVEFVKLEKGDENENKKRFY